ncbi:hypothetical protein Q1695_001557 [Nippostrongylus brasiliensis]|nr:hypothetical protein Q1695_001557 [Nippostrongylus brasiliensis]
MDRRLLQSSSMMTHVGRSPRQELLDDIRDELLRAKKKNAQLALNNRTLNTKLQRLTREAEKRNRSAQIRDSEKPPNNQNNIMPRKTNSQKERRCKHTIYRGSSAGTSKLPAQARSEPIKEVKPRASPTMEDDDEIVTMAGSDTQDGHMRDLYEKNRKRLKVAKAYAEQNRKLKERLKQIREQVRAMKTNAPLADVSPTPSTTANDFENWDISELVEVIKTLSNARLRNHSQTNGNVVERKQSETINHSKDAETLSRLQDAERKMAQLRSENEKLRKDMEFYKEKVDMFSRASNPSARTKHSIPSESFPDSVRIPPLDISQTSDTVSPDREQQRESPPTYCST